MDRLWTHWPELTGLVGTGAAVSLKWFPRPWRAIWRVIVGPFRAEIDRERRMAREEFVGDLLQEVEWYRTREDRRRSEDADA